MKNTYWNHNGKYQSQVDEIEKLVPSFGYTYNPKMNLFLLVSHLYYDAYNNGGGSIVDCYASDFEKYVPEELKQKIKLEFFAGVQHDKMESAMNAVLEYLNGADLHYTPYRLWRINKTKQISMNQQAGDNWFDVTFGSLVEKVEYIKDVESRLGYSRFTPHESSPFEALPVYCSRCGDFLYYSSDRDVAEVLCMHCGYYHADRLEQGKVVELYHNAGYGSCLFTGSGGTLQCAIPFPYSREKAMKFFSQHKNEYEGELLSAQLTWWDDENKVFHILVNDNYGK